MDLARGRSVLQVAAGGLPLQLAGALDAGRVAAHRDAGVAAQQDVRVAVAPLGPFGRRRVACGPIVRVVRVGQPAGRGRLLAPEEGKLRLGGDRRWGGHDRGGDGGGGGDGGRGGGRGRGGGERPGRDY